MNGKEARFADRSVFRGQPQPPVRKCNKRGQNMFCPNCGCENKEEASFCKRCGCVLKRKPPVCKACGHENDVEARFCENCGASLEERNNKPQLHPAPITQKAKEERALQTKKKAIEISSLVLSILGICYFALSIFLIFGSYTKTRIWQTSTSFNVTTNSLFDYLVSTWNTDFFAGGSSSYAQAIGDILNSTVRPIVFIVALLGVAALIAFAVFGIVSIARGLHSKTVPNAKTPLILSLLTVVSVSSLLLSTTAYLSSGGQEIVRCSMGAAPISLLIIGCFLLVFEIVLEALRDYDKTVKPIDIAITIIQSLIPFFFLFLVSSFGGKYAQAVIVQSSVVLTGKEGFMAYFGDILTYLASDSTLKSTTINQVIGVAAVSLAINLVIAAASIGMAPWLLKTTRKKKASVLLIVIPSIYFVLSILFVVFLPIENVIIGNLSSNIGETLKIYSTGAGPICFVLFSLLLLGLGIALFVILKQKARMKEY